MAFFFLHVCRPVFLAGLLGFLVSCCTHIITSFAYWLKLTCKYRNYMEELFWESVKVFKSMFY